jgi:hypothetical protein
LKTFFQSSKVSNKVLQTPKNWSKKASKIGPKIGVFRAKNRTFWDFEDPVLGV